MPVFLQALCVAAVMVLTVMVVWLTASRRWLAADVERFAGFMEHGPFVAFMKDADGRYVYENRAMVDLMARIRPGTTTVLGCTDRELFGNSFATSYIDHDRTVIEHGKPLQFDEMSVEPDGNVRHWSTIKFPRLDGRGRPCVAGISIDVTQLRQARDAARSSADQVALALEAGHMGTLTLDLTTQMLETSSVFAVLHGRPETKTRLTLDESLADVHPDDRPKIVAAVQSALRDKAPNRITYRVVLPAGDTRWIELVGRVSVDEDGRPIVVRGVGFDVTESRTAYDELDRRKTILRRLIEVQENERQTLCHELHDGLIQYAIAAKMQLDGSRDEADAALRSERIDAAVDCLERGIAEGRQLIRGVRPAVLDDLGLRAAIEDLAEQMAAAGITVDVSLDEGIDTVPPALRTTIYRVVQESLTNARKHSGADRAAVEIRRVGDEVHVRVHDAGTAFDVAEARKRGFGLVGMAERMRLAGGSFWIESQPRSGTQVHARLPVPASAEPCAEVASPTAYAAAAPADLAP